MKTRVPTCLLALAALPLTLLLACGDKDDTDPVGDDGGGDVGGDDGGDDGSEDCVPVDEVCDGVDNDCDGDIDEDATDAVTFFTDADGDGFGDDDAAVQACELAVGLAAEGGDCDDADPAVSPGATEVCNGLDDDCDGGTDGIAVPGDQPELQDALDAAADGELICLVAGAYVEELSLSGKGVRIEGAGAGETVLMSPTVGGTALTLSEADGTELSGLGIVGLYVEETEGFAATEVSLQDTSCTETSCMGQAARFVTSTVSLTEVDVTGHTVSVSDAAADTDFVGLVQATNSDLVWVGGEIRDNELDYYVNELQGSGLLDLQGGTARLEELTIADNAWDAVVTDHNGSSATANLQGGLIRLYANDTELVDVDLTDNVVNTDISYSDLAPSSPAPSATTAAQSTSWIYAQGGSLTWTGGRISGNESDNDGGTYAHSFGMRLTVDEASLSDLEVFDNTLDARSSGSAECAGLYTNGGAVDLTRVDVRGNALSCYLRTSSDQAWNYGLFVHWSSDALTYDNVVVAGNSLYTTAYQYGLFSFNYTYSPPELRQLTVHTNWSEAGLAKSGGIHLLNTGGLTVVGSVFSDNDLQLYGGTEAQWGGASTLWADTGGAPDLSYSLLYDNVSNSGLHMSAGGTDVTATVMAGTGVLDADPTYVLDNTSEPLDWDLRPADGSPLVDAGHPDDADPDGSAADIGAYGGPLADW